MRRFVRRLTSSLMATATCLALSAPARAQAPAAPPTAAPPVDAQAPPAPAAAAPADTSASLFAPSDNMVQLSGRLTGISGDLARAQRYQDLRDGLLVTGARLLREGDGWRATAGADNTGWRDQRYFAAYERIGRVRIRGLWDEIPQFYSVDTRTPYTLAGDGALVLDDAVQRAIQDQTATLNAYVPIAPQFDLRERRAIGTLRVEATPAPQVDVTGGFTSTAHSGELPWGASFGFSNDTEVALPYRSRTDDLDIGVEWRNSRSMIRTAYTSSWFDNQADTLVWDSPLQLTDAVELPGRGRSALWPSNSLNTLSTAGYTKFARRTQVTGSLAIGWWNNDQPLLPFTINSALPTFDLPRASAEASAQSVSTNIGLVSRPVDDWRFSTRFRRYDFNNGMPATSITDYISLDSEASTTPTGGPKLLAHDRNTFDADATWTGLGQLAFTVGYTNNHHGYDFRIFDSTTEHLLQLKADAVGPGVLTFRTRYEYGSRNGSGLDEASLTEIGEQPALRHYDVANRTRRRLVGQVDVAALESLILSFSTGIGADDFDDSGFGLQEAAFRNVTFGVDYQAPRNIVVGGSYDYERYSGLQRSRSASPGVQAEDPNRDWTVDSRENVHYFSIYLQPPRLGRATEARASYNYSLARGNYFYDVGAALPPPSQLPETFNKLQNLTLDVRHRVTGHLAATLSYVYEPFRVYDFAFDPTVVDGIVQPSSLVLGYTYRPYTTHSAVLGVQFFW